MTSDVESTPEEGSSTGELPTSSGSTAVTSEINSFSFTLSSPDHQDATAFAPEATCEACGFNADLMVMPGLEWTPGPAGTMSYALVFVDATLYAMNDPLGNHWAIWNIPASTLTLPKGMKMADIPEGATQTGNFLGPCPSFGGQQTHEYEFALYALPTATVDFNSQGMSTQVVGQAITAFEAQKLEKVVLTGSSSAAPGQSGACN